MTTHTLKDFWLWWCTSQREPVMEVRIKDVPTIKHIAKTYKLPYSMSGVYVSTYQELFTVVKHCRDNVTMWFGINPRKKAYNQFNTLSYGGKDVNVYTISYIFCDIDRIHKDAKATEQELTLVKSFSDIIIQKLRDINVTQYCRICSGNGVQLLIPLDVPIVLPTLTYNEETKTYTHNEQFEQLKHIIPKTVGKLLVETFNTKAYKEKYGCEVDAKGFNMGRVGALHGTYNFKYGEKIPRFVIDFGSGVNTGLSDSILTMFKQNDAPVFTVKKSSPLALEFQYRADTIVNAPLTQYLLHEKNMPKGMRNNYLLFQWKCLLQDNGIPLHSTEVQHIKKQIEHNLQDTFALGYPGPKYHFNPNIVNHFMILHGLKPLYPILFDKPKRRTYNTAIFCWENYLGHFVNEGYNIKEPFDPQDILYELCKSLPAEHTNLLFMFELYKRINAIERHTNPTFARVILEHWAKDICEKT